jgi:nitrite reductase/ring-hydroxylating ferredoxin subunit
MSGGAADADSMELSELREGEINVKVLRSGRKAVVIKQGDNIAVFDEVCPHMGGDMTTATYCASEGTLACSWHGYVFGADDGRFRDNPNERLMRVLREPSEHYRPEIAPKFRLRALPFVIKGSTLFFEGDGSIGGDGS